MNDKLYKRGVSTSLLRCLNDKEAKEVLSEIHDGVYDAEGHSLAYKALLQGFYWPTMKQDAADYVRKCDKCQRYSTLIRAHPERLTVVFCSWPFEKWGIHIICRRGDRLLHKVGRGYSFVNYQREEPDQVHLQIHHLQVRNTSLLGFRQCPLV